MAVVGLEIVDAALVAVREGTRAAASPGVAIVSPAGLKVGEEAAAQLRLQPVLAADREVPQRPFRNPVAAFVEPHIEQGPVLERAGVPIGVVTGIQGTRRYRVHVTGEAAHAGTAERHERRDALMAALRMIAAIDRAAAEPADTKLTVGMIEVTPNAPSIVRAQALFSMDLRQPLGRDVCEERSPRSGCIVTMAGRERCRTLAHRRSESMAIATALPRRLAERPRIRIGSARAIASREVPMRSTYGLDRKPLSIGLTRRPPGPNAGRLETASAPRRPAPTGLGPPRPCS